MKCEYVECKRIIPEGEHHIQTKIINAKDKKITEETSKVHFCSPQCLTDMFLYMGYGSEKEISTSFGIIVNKAIKQAINDKYIPKDLRAGK